MKFVFLPPASDPIPEWLPRLRAETPAVAFVAPETDADALRERGADTIACLAVNDVFVMSAWGTAGGADGKVAMLADGNGAYARALGLELDASGFGMGMRAQRFSMIVKDGVVSHLNIEPAAGEVGVSSAEDALDQLG